MLGSEYTNTISSYMTERNWMTDVLKSLGTKLGTFKAFSDVQHAPNSSISFKVRSERITMSVVDIPYPPIRPEFLMAEVQITKRGPREIEGLKIPFTEEAHGAKNVRMWGYEQDTAKNRDSFLNCLVQELTSLAFNSNNLDYARLHQIVMSARDEVNQAPPFSLDAVRASTPAHALGK